MGLVKLGLGPLRVDSQEVKIVSITGQITQIII